MAVFKSKPVENQRRGSRTYSVYSRPSGSNGDSDLCIILHATYNEVQKYLNKTERIWKQEKYKDIHRTRDSIRATYGEYNLYIYFKEDKLAQKQSEG